MGNKSLNIYKSGIFEKYGQRINFISYSRRTPAPSLIGFAIPKNTSSIITIVSFVQKCKKANNSNSALFASEELAPITRKEP